MLARKLFPMLDDKERLIEELKKEFRTAMRRAQALRTLAGTQSTEEQRTEYARQADFEEDKAKGHLKHAEILAKSDL